MKDAYTLAFYDAVKETKDKTGYELPEHLEAYVVMLLASFVERTDYLPEKSFIESYMILVQKRSRNIKALGDTCLFVTGVFPHYKNKNGLDVEYFSNIGSNSYLQVAEMMHPSLFNDLSNNFSYVRDFISLTVTNSDTGLHDYL
jgi:hypothetical protein